MSDTDQCKRQNDQKEKNNTSKLWFINSTWLLTNHWEEQVWTVQSQLDQIEIN